MRGSLTGSVFCTNKRLQSCPRTLTSKITRDNFFFSNFFTYRYFQKSSCGVSNDTSLVRLKSSNYTVNVQKYEKIAKLCFFQKFPRNRCQLVFLVCYRYMKNVSLFIRTLNNSTLLLHFNCTTTKTYYLLPASLFPPLKRHCHLATQGTFLPSCFFAARRQTAGSTSWPQPSQFHAQSKKKLFLPLATTKYNKRKVLIGSRKYVP